MNKLWKYLDIEVETVTEITRLLGVQYVLTPSQSICPKTLGLPNPPPPPTNTKLVLGKSCQKGSQDLTSIILEHCVMTAQGTKHYILV